MRQTIKIAISFDVINPHALGALDDYVKRMIIVCSMLVFKVDKFLSTR